MTAETQRSLRGEQNGQGGLLAVHPGALGDVVLFGHFLAAARAANGCAPLAPSASSAPLWSTVALVAGGEKARLLQQAGVVDAARDFESLPMHEVFLDTAPGECRLPGLLAPCARLLSCFAAGDARAERRLARLCGAGRADFLPTRPPADYAGHLTDVWAEALGLPRPVPPAAWRIPEAWRGQAAEALRCAGADPARPYAVLHPGAGAEAKCWPLDGFLAAARALRRGGLGPVFVLGPVELDRWRDGRLERVRAAGPLLAGQPLETLAGLLAPAACYVGNDSGASHLAAAVGTPTVAVFGPTNPAHFRPLGRRAAVVAAAEAGWPSAHDVLGAVRQVGGDQRA